MTGVLRPVPPMLQVLARLSQVMTAAAAEGLAAVLSHDADPADWPSEELEATPEHPWAFQQIQALGEELTILEVGGEDPGLRETLARAGHRVISVGARLGGPAPDGAVLAMGVDALRQADLPAASVDVLVSIRGLGHLPAPEADAVVQKSRRLLRGGGHVVLSTGDADDVQPVLEALDAELLTGELVAPRGFLDLAVGTRAQSTVAFARCFVARKR